MWYNKHTKSFAKDIHFEKLKVQVNTYNKYRLLRILQQDDNSSGPAKIESEFTIFSRL